MRTLGSQLRLEGGSLLRGQNNQRAFFVLLLSSLGCSRHPLGEVVKLNSGELKALHQLWSATEGNSLPEVNEPFRRHVCTIFISVRFLGGSEKKRKEKKPPCFTVSLEICQFKTK